MRYFEDANFLTEDEIKIFDQFDTQIKYIENLFSNNNFIAHILELICKSNPNTEMKNPTSTVDLINKLKHKKDVYDILNTKKTLNDTMKTTIDKINKNIKVVNDNIDDTQKKSKIRFNATDIFNNDEQYINIQNKLIYLIRYKYNIFLSILFVIGMIVTYHYLIPTLQIPISITNTIAPS